MLPKGSILKVYEYYFTAHRYSDEIMRALREFFDCPDLKRGGSFEADEKSEELFNEWFLYDFALANGKTILADFVAENPLRFSAAEMILYRNLLETNAYGLYEVVSVDIKKGLMLKNSQTGKEMYVYEQKLTLQVKPGDIFFGRVGRVNNHYELIGADTFLLNGLSKAVRKSLCKISLKLTPKVAHDIWKRQ